MAAPPLKGITRIKAPGCEVHWDDTYSPIFFANTVGVVNMEVMEQWYAVRNPAYARAMSLGQKAMLVSDVSNMTPPDAVMRKELALLGEKEDEAFRGVVLGQVFIMSNPVLRGVVTALQWISPNALVPTVTAASLKDAARQVERHYTRAGLPMPPYPDNYAFEKITL
ncbi:hypothetical protein ENSA5_31440 [Enhygromyxa salina]|uniref:Uncharacterized protein n=1 Tax=Enhygromyxa salina TaxID=215803 RepID=A0A2S9XYU2_9BACT|nr:hypothetical protein [Enhygromyxa salina]PRP97910.1 hypothetical protein ENSA5_31440 [Enhygromyxa salina]